MKRFLILLLILLSAFPLAAQTASFKTMDNLHIPGTQWLILEGGSLPYIFPESATEDALRAAATAESYYGLVSGTLPVLRSYRYPVVFSYSGMIPNGMVQPFPRHSVWYLGGWDSPLSNLPWTDSLAVHEIRHMHQLDSANQSFSRFLFFLWGETGFGPAWTTVPWWLLEGDAVLTETLYSDGGRGRTPDFSKEMKALVLEGYDYNYWKYLGNSYRTPLPDWYQYGYLMSAYLRSEYGDDSISGIFHTSAAIPLPSVGGSIGVFRTTGLGFYGLHKEMMEYYRAEWDAQQANVPVYEVETLLEGDLRFGNEFFCPVRTEEGDLILWEKTLNTPGRIVRITPEGRTAFLSGGSGEVRLSVSSGRAVYAKLRRHPKFTTLSWSDLVVIDLSSGNERFLSRKERYLDPALSPDGNLIAAIQIDTVGGAQLVVLDVETGELLQAKAFPDNLSCSWPSWSSDGRRIVLTGQTAQGRGLYLWNRETDLWTELLSGAAENLRTPVWWNNRILFVSDYTGIDNLHGITLEGERFVLTSRPYGIGTPSVRGNEVLFTDYTGTEGYSVVRIDISTADWIPLAVSSVYHEDFFRNLDSGEGGAPEESPDLPSPDNIRPYRPLRDGFRIHSWGIITDADSLTPFVVPAGIIGSDVLGTIYQELGLRYNLNEQSLFAGYTIVEKYWYPDISFNADIGSRNLQDNTSGLADAYVRVSVPFGRYSRSSSWRTDVHVQGGISSSFDTVNGQVDESIIPFQYGASFSHQISGSDRAYRPLVAESLLLQYTHAPLETDSVYRLTMAGRVILPGIFPDHSVLVQGGWENQSGDFIMLIPISRGYRQEETMTEVRKFSLTYEFPLLYPDIPLGGAVYIKRIRGSIFMDRFWDVGGQNYDSSGFEILLDSQILSISVVELSMGMRFSYLENDQRWKAEFLIAGVGLGM